MYLSSPFLSQCFTTVPHFNLDAFLTLFFWVLFGTTEKELVSTCDMISLGVVPLFADPCR